MVELLQERAAKYPERVVFSFVGPAGDARAILTYQQLDRKARAIAQQLQRTLHAGDRVIIAQRPGPNYVTSFFGCLYAGVVAVPSFLPRPHRTMDHLHSIARNCGAASVLADKYANLSALRRGGEPLAHLPWIVVAEELCGSENWMPSPTNPEDIALLQYTSGSTGDPKGVMISHRNVLLNLEAASQCFGLNPSSRGVCWLPPYHDMGLISGMLAPIYTAAEMTIMSPTYFAQRPIRWLEAITSTRATVSGGPNFAFELCVSQTTTKERASLDLSRWEVAFLGAEPIRAETLHRFAKTYEPYGFHRKSFTPCYGMAEGTLLLTAPRERRPPTVYRNGSMFGKRQSSRHQKTASTERIIGCGSAITDHEIAIVDPDSRAPLPDGQEGEILVCGPCVAQGYWNRPNETRSTFNAELTAGNKKRYLRTGDLGFLSGGELFVSGRIKDLMIIRGRNHHPHDIERAIESCHSGLKIARSAVFSIDVSGEERAIAVIETPVMRTRGEFVSIRSSGSNGAEGMMPVLSAIRQTIATRDDLELYDVVLVKLGTIPLTTSGKIRRHACRLMFLQKLSGAPFDLSR